MKSLKKYSVKILIVFFIFSIGAGAVFGKDKSISKPSPAKVGRFKAAKFYPGHINYVAHKDSTWREMLH